MALERYQREVQLNRLYSVKRLGSSSGSERLDEYISVNSGSVDIYACTTSEEPTSLSDMTLKPQDVGVYGQENIKLLPNYVAFVQNSGTTTELVLSGIEAIDLGAIS